VAALLAEHATGLDARRSADLLRAAAGILAVSTGAATVRVWTVADRVVCEIRAAGDIADFMAGRVVPDPDSPRGRALRAADLLCDLVQTHTTAGATVTRLHAVLSGVRRG
jgi:hypothetical protein